MGSLDPFYEEDIAYANRLAAAGVQCEQLVVDGAFPLRPRFTECRNLPGVPGRKDTGTRERPDLNTE